jgi:hypothetical protein
MGRNTFLLIVATLPSALAELHTADQAADSSKPAMQAE